MSEDTFLLVFLMLAGNDFYLSMVQRTTLLISRMGDAVTCGCFLNPKFIRYAFPLTLAKWGWVLYWVISGNTSVALVSLFFSWLAAVVLPVPSSITPPAIRSQISHVHELDSDLGQYLSKITDQWEQLGSRG